MTVHQALEKLVPAFVGIYGDLVESIVLFGSTARGTDSAESDVDIAVIVRSPVPKEIEERMPNCTDEAERLGLLSEYQALTETLRKL